MIRHSFICFAPRCVRDRNERELARKKFRHAMREEIMNKAPGMKFVLDIADENKKLTPRVIHALGKTNAFSSFALFSLFSGRFYDLLAGRVFPFIQMCVKFAWNLPGARVPGSFLYTDVSTPTKLLCRGNEERKKFRPSRDFTYDLRYGSASAQLAKMRRPDPLQKT